MVCCLFWSNSFRVYRLVYFTRKVLLVSALVYFMSRIFRVYKLVYFISKVLIVSAMVYFLSKVFRVYRLVYFLSKVYRVYRLVYFISKVYRVYKLVYFINKVFRVTYFILEFTLFQNLLYISIFPKQSRTTILVVSGGPMAEFYHAIILSRLINLAIIL